MPFRRISPAVLALAALAACSDGYPTGPADLDPSLAQADGPIPTRQEQRPGTFIEKSDAELWSFVQASDGLVAVGLKAPGGVRGTWRGKVLVDRNQKAQGRAAVLAQRGVQLLSVDELLPILRVRLARPGGARGHPQAAVRGLRGAGDGAQDGVAVRGRGRVRMGERVDGRPPVHLHRRRVLAKVHGDEHSRARGASAAARGSRSASSTAASRRARGSSPAPSPAGQSTGRTLSLLRISSQASAYDDCGHGTRMAGIIAAPWDGQNVAGIAYRASLVSVRHASGVAAVSASDAAASVRLANHNGAQVIVMAWESLNWLWQVSDEIEYWHYGRQVLFFGAAGTSGCWDGILDSNVIFPADMPEVVAVTGVTYPGGGVPCGIHHGSDVELTSYLDVPSTGRYTADVVGMGGSSNATAVAGGIAALVWSRNPTMTRDQVRARLQQTAQYYPSRNCEEGYGLMNALKAVRGY